MQWKENISLFKDFFSYEMSTQLSLLYCLSLWDNESINLSKVAFDLTKCCVLCIISTLHVYHTVHCALSGCDGHNAHLPGSWPARCGMFTVMLSQNALLAGSWRDCLVSGHILYGVFSLSGFPLWSWPVVSWTQRVQKKSWENKVGRRGGDCY